MRVVVTRLTLGWPWAWRLGAGLDAADVDTASFIARTTAPHTIIIDEEKPVGDIAAKAQCC